MIVNTQNATNLNDTVSTRNILKKLNLVFPKNTRIVERLVLQAFHVLSKEILQFPGLKSAVHNRVLFQIKSGL